MVSKKDIQELKDMVIIQEGILHKHCLLIVNGTPREFIVKLNRLLKKH